MTVEFVGVIFQLYVESTFVYNSQTTNDTHFTRYSGNIFQVKWLASVP